MNILLLSNIDFNNKKGFFNSVISRIKCIVNKVDNYKYINIVDSYASYKELIKNSKSIIIYEGLEIESIKNKYFIHSRILRKFKKNYFINKNLREILKIIKKEKFDIIHAHWAYPMGFIAYRLSRILNIPYVLTVHGSDIHTNPLVNKYIKKYTLIALEHANKVEFVSKDLLNFAKETLKYTDFNSCIIPNGVDLEKFYIYSENLKFIVNKRFVVGYVGSLRSIKGTDRLPIIFKNIYETNKNIEFLVVGDGDLKSEVQNKCKTYSINVNFVGNIAPENIPIYMNKMDILIVPSRNEGWPCVILEANACGVYVIATNVGGNKEAVGQYGSIIENDVNVEVNIAREVNNILFKGVDKESLSARCKEFSWDNICEKEYVIYNEVLKMGE